MVQNLFDNYIFIYAMAGLCALGVLIKIVVSRTYKRLVKASDNMGTTKHKLMKLMKMKFEACYKLKIGVNNVDSFVDKYVYKHKVCGIHLYTWENIGGQLLILCLLTGTVGSVVGLAYDCGKNNILLTFFAGILTSSLLIIVESFINIGAKKNVIKANIIDYLDNFLKIRLEHENLTPQILKEYGEEYFNTEKGIGKKKDKQQEKSKTNTKEMVERLRKEEEALRQEREKEKSLKIASVYVSKVDENKQYETQGEKTKRDRDKEMLLREKEQNRLLQQKEKEKSEKEKIEHKNMVEEESNRTQNNTLKDRNEQKYLLYNLMETAASKEDNINTDFASDNLTVDKDSKTRAANEEKIIEEILKEFLA